MYRFFTLLILINIYFSNMVHGSGAFDHGTSTGKGKIQIDLTWNPFNYFKNGQSYIMMGYVISEKLDIHGYYCDHSNYNNGVNSYYLGLYYQFFKSKYIDLATAFGRRKMIDLKYGHFFFPQLLYNFKLHNDFTIGGSIVRVVNENINLYKKTENDWIAFDITLFIPITNLIKEYENLEYIKVGIGVFRTGLINNNIDKTSFLPTYSIDIKFKTIHLLK